MCAGAAREPRHQAARPTLLYYQAQAHRRQKDYAAALYVTTQLIELPARPPRLKALAYNERGLSELSLGNYNNARNDFATAVTLAPADKDFRANRHHCDALIVQCRAEKEFARFAQEIIATTNKATQESLKNLSTANPADGLPVTPQKEAITVRLFERIGRLSIKANESKVALARLSAELISAKAALRETNPETLRVLIPAEEADNNKIHQLNYLGQLLAKAEKHVHAQAAQTGAAHTATMAALEECVTASRVAEKNNADLVRAAQNDPNLKKQLTAASVSQVRQYQANFVSFSIKIGLLGVLAQVTEKLIEIGHEKLIKLKTASGQGLDKILGLYEQRTEELIFYHQTISEIRELTKELNKYNKSLCLFYQQTQENFTELNAGPDYRNYWINIPEFNKRYQAREWQGQIEFAAKLALRQDKIIDLIEVAQNLSPGTPESYHAR